MTLTKIVQNALKAAQIDQSTPLLVAVSGGADSVALLHLLLRCHTPQQVTVCYVNHRLRPAAQTDREAQTAAAMHPTRFHHKTVNTHDYAKQNKLSTEAAARRLRYQALAEVAEAVGATHILTAHHANDQAETVLLHLLRGSGLAGLAGMRPSAPLPISHVPKMRLIRPLLAATRAQIEAYCQQNELQTHHDPSNDDTRFTRNRLRHALLPLMEEIQPNASKHLVQLAEVVSAETDLLHTLTRQALHRLNQNGRLNRAQWQALPLALRRRTLQAAIRQTLPPAAELSFPTLEAARRLAENGHTGQRAPLPAGLSLTLGYNTLLLGSEAEKWLDDAPQLADGAPLTLPVPGKVVLANGWTLIADAAAPADLDAVRGNQDPYRCWLAVTCQQLSLRPRRTGDTLRPLGMHGSQQTIKKMMIDHKIPAAARARWPLVTDSDTILWLPGIRSSHPQRLTTHGQACIALRLVHSLRMDQSHGD